MSSLEFLVCGIFFFFNFYFSFDGTLKLIHILCFSYYSCYKIISARLVQLHIMSHNEDIRIVLHAWEAIIILILMDNLISISDTGTKLGEREKTVTQCWSWEMSTLMLLLPPAGEFRSRSTYSFITHALIELLISIQIWWESHTHSKFP